MGNLFRIRLLPRDVGPVERLRAVARAYALAATVDPCLTPTEWIGFVRRCRRPACHRGGLGILEDRRGYVHAVFRYAVGAGPLLGWSSPARGRTMWLQDIVVGGLPGSAAVRGIAVGAERMARAFGCVAVAMALPPQAGVPPARSPFAALAQRGYGVAVGPVLVRALEA